MILCGIVGVSVDVYVDRAVLVSIPCNRAVKRVLGFIFHAVVLASEGF